MRYFLLVCFVLICTTGMAAAADTGSTPIDGKLIVTLERIGEEYSIRDILVVRGAAPAIHIDGVCSFRLLGSDGKALAQGRLHIPRYIYHDKADRYGNLDGFRQPIDGPVTITLPYVEPAEIIEIRAAEGELILREDLGKIPFRRVAPVVAEFSGDTGLAEYLHTLERAAPPPRTKTIRTQTPPISDPTKVKVTGSVNVKGVTDYNLIWGNISFYKRSDGSYVSFATTDSSGNFSVQLDPGSYYIEATCWYYDPAFNGNAVPLYPLPLTVTEYNTGSSQPSSLTLKWDLNYLFKGLVKSTKGDPVEARVAVLERKFFGSTFQRGIVVSVSTQADGSFGVRLPSRKFAFAVVPKYQDVAGEMLAIKKVKKKTKTVEFTCACTGKTSGAALKQIYGSSDTAGKLNLLFLAEAYTAKNEKFKDKNKNGIWDGDLLLDENGNGKLDSNEYYYDRNGNRKYDKPEKFKDKNKDKICNRYERAQFEYDCAVSAAALLNYRPFNLQAKRINIFTYWMPSQHGTQSFTGFTKPWNMNTALGVSCITTGGFQSGNVDYNLVNTAAAAALPDFTVPIVMVHDPFNALRANAIFGFGCVLMSAEDFRGGAVLTHELGHSIGNLADEYIYAIGATYTGGEPSAANITIETDPAKVKWAQFVKGNPPVPTPFGYDGYGLFEGAAPGSFGVYRPTAYSIMRNTNYPFFKVNESQMSSVLNQFKK